MRPRTSRLGSGDTGVPAHETPLSVSRFASDGWDRISARHGSAVGRVTRVVSDSDGKSTSSSCRLPDGFSFPVCSSKLWQDGVRRARRRGAYVILSIHLQRQARENDTAPRHLHTTVIRQYQYSLIQSNPIHQLLKPLPL